MSVYVTASERQMLEWPKGQGQHSRPMTANQGEFTFKPWVTGVRCTSYSPTPNSKPQREVVAYDVMRELRSRRRHRTEAEVCMDRELWRRAYTYAITRYAQYMTMPVRCEPDGRVT